ncbi:MAG TPA: DUF5671 domain-containing protein [Bryobacteraceae bacterium]|nr:DUF5671 domain-containing protein [Bryobacteraceae bacterium]
MQPDTIKLNEFIEASKSKGASDEFLATLLTRCGWPADDVYGALGSYWQQTTGLPVPERTAGGESSRDAFLYLLSFSTLATWSTALGSMLFRFIDRRFPDPVSRDHLLSMRSEVTWQMASIAVAFPIFLLVTRTILREAQNSPERLQSGVRKWLTYIALLVTAGAMICDLIWFLDYFLNGELTSRFVLKALTVMIICGAIFIYYIGSLRWDRNTDVATAKRRSFKFGLVSCAAVVAAFCIGLGVAGTPSQQRHIEADRQRVEDLKAIANSIHFRYLRAKTDKTVTSLPARLSDIPGRTANRSFILDPETQAPYVYRPKSESTYEMCAAFSSPSEPGRFQVTDFWYHGEGETCFTLDASQQPPY